MAFIACTSNYRKIEKLLSILSADGNTLNNKIDGIIDQIQQDANNALLSTSVQIDAAIENINTQLNRLIVDYLCAPCNQGDQLAKFYDDLNEFKDMLNKCPSSKARNMLLSLGMGKPLPKSLDPQLYLTEYQDFVNHVQDLSNFPLNYLKQNKDILLDKLSNEILQLSGNLKEFNYGKGIDALDNTFVGKIRDVAQEALATMQCLRRMACGNEMSTLINDYNDIVSTMKVSPQLPQEDPNKPKFKPLDNVKLDVDQIINSTSLGMTEKGNTIMAVGSYKDAMSVAKKSILF